MSYAASQGWLIIQDDTLTLTTAGMRFEPDVIVECTGVGQVIRDAIGGIGAGYFEANAGLQHPLSTLHE